MKALILYGTRYGFTGKTARVIESVLSEKGVKVDVIENKAPRGIGKELNTYDLVVVGSSIVAGMWKSGAKAFLKKYGGKIKNLYLFVTAAGCLNAVESKEISKEEAVKSATERYINPLTEKYGLTVGASAVLGGQFGKGDKIKYNNWNEQDIRAFAENLV